MTGFEDPDAVDRITDRKRAIEKAIKDGSANTMILIAGKGHETYQEVMGERHEFDDRQVTKAALKQNIANPKNMEG